MYKIKATGIKKLGNGYGVNFKPFKVNSYVYVGAKVKSSSIEHCKLQIDLIAYNNKKKKRIISFVLLDNGNITTLKRKSTFGVELHYKLTTIVQLTAKIVMKYRNKSKNTDNEVDESSKQEAEKSSKPTVNNTCMISDCNKEAVVPDSKPLFCEEHTHVAVV